MKPFVTLLIILLTCVCCIAQQPPKKASKIIVLTKDSTNTLLNRITLALFDKGFTIEGKDESLKLLTTKERPNKNGMTLTKIRASINDTAVVFTSQMALAVDLNIGGVTAKQTFDPVTYSGLKKSYMMEAWNELDEIAKLFGDKIFYSK